MADEDKGDAPQLNVFGEPIVAGGGSESGAGESEAGEGGEKKGGEKKFESIPDDHPTIVALRGEIEKVKSEYGTNLSGQRDIIKTLEGKIDALQGGKKGGEDENVLFKDIKRSKDLTDEERENMTETEIKQMDEIAEMKEAQNKMYAALNKKETQGAEDRNGTVRALAQKLAKESAGKDDTALANQIIENFNLFDQTKIKPEQVEEFVKRAAGQVSTYKPPKEPVTKRGGAVKEGKGGSDPFGVDAVVESAHKQRESGGNYKL